MSVLEGVLKEEVARLEKNISSYEKIIGSLPKGSIFVRQIGSSFFAYRKRKENGVVLSEYLGNINNESVKEQIKLSEEYHRIKKNIQVAKAELLKLKRAIKIYD